MPINTDQFDVEISQAVADKLVIATKDRIEVYTQPGNEMVHQEAVNYPGQLTKHAERDQFLQDKFTAVAKKVAAGKIKKQVATLVDDDEDSLLDELKNPKA